MSLGSRVAVWSSKVSQAEGERPAAGGLTSEVVSSAVLGVVIFISCRRSVRCVHVGGPYGEAVGEAEQG